MSTLKELQDAFNRAHLSRERLKKAREHEEYIRLEAFKTELRNELEAKYGADQKRAWEDYYSAEKALDNEKDRLARLGKGGKYPVGTKLVRKKPTYKWSSTLVDRFGVYECVTTDSQFPVPRSGRRYRDDRPELGSYVVRLLKKDGSPSLNFYKCNLDGSLPYGWAVAGGAV